MYIQNEWAAKCLGRAGGLLKIKKNKFPWFGDSMNLKNNYHLILLQIIIMYLNYQSYN